MHLNSQINGPAKMVENCFDFGNILQFPTMGETVINIPPFLLQQSKAMHPEKYSLTWHTYSDHLKSMMRELMMNQDFSDVTLVTEDKKHIKANISILSACSPVFKDFLKKDRHSNAIMYLRGIQFSELESIMQFIYLGEATFYEERMDEFLAVAKSLEIKKLCNTETEPNNEPGDDPTLIDHETETLKKQTVISDFINKQTSHEVNVGVSSLYNLNQSVHQGVKYACDQCDYQATKQSHLTIHIQSIHEGIKYACDQCDYQASTQSSLTSHIQSVHKSLKNACNQCDYQATRQGKLRRHIEINHRG